jgi:O-antigen/teichoic acid export membrane protein
MLANQPNGYGELGVFNAASQWRTAIAFIPTVLCQPLLATLSHLTGVREFASFRRVLRANLLVNMTVCAAMAAIVILASQRIMKAYGDDFAAGRNVLILLVLSSVVSSTSNVIGQAIASLSRMWSNLGIGALWAAVQLASAYVLVRRFGASGLATAFLLSYIVHAVAVAAYTWYVLPRHLQSGHP